MRRFVLCTLLAGCATASTKASSTMDMDAGWLHTVFPSAPEFVAYLERPTTTSEVCWHDPQEPALTTFDVEIDKALVAELVDGRLDAERWRSCVNAFVESGSAKQSAALDGEIGRGYRALMRRRDFETNPALQKRLRAMQAYYLAGTNRIDGVLLVQLRRDLAAGKLGPVGRALGDELIAEVDLEHGRFDDRTVDGALLDELYAQEDIATLLRMATRLPTQTVRDEARRRVIRLRIAASSIPYVRAHASEVEERVFATGVNAIHFDEQKPLSASLDPSKFNYRGVLVEQNLVRQSAALVGYTGASPSESVQLVVDLHGLLHVQVEGLSDLVTLCRPVAQPDTTPCIAAKDVSIDNALASVDADGDFRFTSNLSMQQAVALGAKANRVALSLLVGGKSLLAFDWPLSYARPADLVLTTPVVGGNAVDLAVSVDHRDPTRFVFTADDGHVHFAVVEAADLGAFHLISAGGRGARGSSGSAGTNGFDGGDCGTGTDGGAGGDGGPGGPGGNGGDVTVRISCGATRCDDDVVVLRPVVLSVAGAGGDGGGGGSGGAGGNPGGDRADSTHTDPFDGQTVVDQPGCRGGPGGRSGSDGTSGPPGRPGRAGIVTFVP